MNWFLRLLNALRQRLGRRTARPRVTVLQRGPLTLQPPATGQQHHRPPVNAAQYALHETFPSCHAAEEETAFRFVGPDGVVEKQLEEWFREGNSMRQRMRITKVVTVSKEIVAVDQLKGICWCGGYDDLIARCALCARALCRLHTRRLDHPDGQLILCDQHYRQLLNQLNTWELLDRSRKSK